MPCSCRASIGSSPRTRGTGSATHERPPRSRFIPAHAGNSWFAATCCVWRSVHPRARGEQRRQSRSASSSAGSSPRTRGTGNARARKRECRRFIPAHAGNRSASHCCQSAAAVHPRARGEQARLRTAAARLVGSSPRTRGTVHPHHRRRAPARFIPAHAGNRSPPTTRPSCAPVHPRARGEQERDAMRLYLITGSSPRTRGTAAGHRRVRARRRFIPAHAGNSGGFWRACAFKPVHPRARGEQQFYRSLAEKSTGSSPRTRGTGVGGLHGQHVGRFIPAHAGNRPRQREEQEMMTVHPRARGEQGVPGAQLGNALGSSPRTRGTGHRQHASGQIGRFIPAHAGNSTPPSPHRRSSTVHLRARGEQEVGIRLS